MLLDTWPCRLADYTGVLLGRQEVTKGVQGHFDHIDFAFGELSMCTRRQEHCITHIIRAGLKIRMKCCYQAKEVTPSSNQDGSNE